LIDLIRLHLLLLLLLLSRCLDSTGDEVQGWLALPGEESEGPWPTILHTHGGPTSIQMQSYNPAAQAWLDAGFAWCSVNYHGSTECGPLTNQPSSQPLAAAFPRLTSTQEDPRN
jgi:hypothetical protein